MNDDWISLAEECENCHKCELGQRRHHMVFGDGNRNARVMLIGEGPGEQEDIQGIPFVGPAGKLLDDMMEMIDLDRKKVYIANIVKCRPPRNRDPFPEEQNRCFGFLERQIELVDPAIIVCLGRIAAAKIIRENFRITREHGTWHQARGRYCTALYHPSALLRDLSKRPETFEDLRGIRQQIRAICPEVYADE